MSESQDITEVRNSAVKTSVERRQSYANMKSSVKLTTTPPVVQVFAQAKSIFSKELNKYQLYREMARVDPELSGDLADFAFTVGSCYNGIIIESGKELDEKEKYLLEVSNKLADEFMLKDRFFVIGKHVARDGNCVYCMDPTDALKVDTVDVQLEDGKTVKRVKLQEDQKTTLPDKLVKKLQLLPMPFVTAVDELTEILDVSAQISKGNYYVLNEASSEKRKIYPSNKILHFKLEPEGAEISDLQGRYTFGVWSESPLDPLKLTVLYKRSMILDDIVVRHRMVPREHHKVPLEAFVPENYSGTPTEKISAAKTAAEAELALYKETIKGITPDQHYITNPEVEIEIIEPRSTTYKEPNESIDQQSRSIHRAMGMPPMSGEIRSSYAYGLIIASYSSLRAKSLAIHIKNKFDAFLRQQLKFRADSGNYKMDSAVVTFTDDELAKVGIKLQLVLEKDRSEMMRRAAMMSQMGVFTRNEIRDEAGYIPLGKEELPNVVSAPATRVKSPGQTTSDEMRRRDGIDWEDTPQSKERTRGGGQK